LLHPVKCIMDLSLLKLKKKDDTRKGYLPFIANTMVQVSTS